MLTADLSGKTAIVTGASSGFGAHFAKVLAKNGATVIAAARRADKLATLVQEIENSGGRAAVLELDVTDHGAINAAFDDIGAVDIVVNNAGVSGTSSAIDTPKSEWEWTFDVNVHGVFYVAQAAAQSMKTRESTGSIINIASVTGYRPAAGSAAYAASKAAVAHMTKCLATDWSRYNIRVNAIAPGYFETDINREFLASDYGERMIRRVPQRRSGQMRELDGPLLLLASDASSYMTGACIEVDGGHLCSPL